MGCITQPFFIGENMTVPVSNRLSQLYVGNGVNTRFDFMFRAFGQENATGIAVRVKVGSEFEPLDDSLYEATLNQDGLGGYITFTSPPSASTFFYISGHTPVDQLLDITNYDNFYPDAIERALDKITAILQEWGSLIDFEEQSRILADINYDLLAQARETDLKNYIDTIVANITGAPLAESQFVTYVDSVSDLPTLLKWDGRIAYVKDVSHFEYKESSDTWGLKITPIAAGGTGSTTEEGARAKLDVYSQAEVDLKIDEATPDASTEVKGLAKIATIAIAKTGVNDTDFITAKKLRDALNASGVLPVYGLRSWGIIKGTTTPASLGRGVNVASIVDEGVGQYKVTFITAMPNIDYVILTGATSYSTTDLGNYGAVKMGSKTVNGFSIVCGAQNYADIPEIYFGVTY